MASVSASDAARVPRLVLSLNETVATARAKIAAAELPGAPVVDARRLKGSVSLDELEGLEPTLKLSEISLDGPVVTADDGLDDALALLADAHRSWAPVTADDALVGVVSVNDVMAAYRSALAQNVRQVRSVGQSGALVEADLGSTSSLVGRTVAEAAWPRDSVLVSIARGDRVIIPRGHVVLEVGDRLTIFTAPAGREALGTLLGVAIADTTDAPAETGIILR